MAATKENGRGTPTYVIVHKFDLWQRQGVVQAHEDGRLHEDVDQVHDLVPKEEGSRPQPCVRPTEMRAISEKDFRRTVSSHTQHSSVQRLLVPSC